MGVGSRVRVRLHRHAVALQLAGAELVGGAGDTRSVLHAGLASVRLGVRRPGRSSAELATVAGAAYELGARELEGHGVPMQPYPDP